MATFCCAFVAEFHSFVSWMMFQLSSAEKKLEPVGASNLAPYSRAVFQTGSIE